MEKKLYRLEINLIDTYFQKSYKFLYPLLNIPIQSEIVPIQTYVEWKGNITRDACKLMCVYKLTGDISFKQFEQSTLLADEMFVGYREGEDNKCVYIFNLQKYKGDFESFLAGKYSKYSEPAKARILKYFFRNKLTTEYIDSYLNPEKYYGKYSEHLNVSVELLQEVGELCDPWNQTKEQLVLKEVAKPGNSKNLQLF